MPRIRRGSAVQTVDNVTKFPANPAAENTAPPPWPPAFDMEQYWARGYHLVLAFRNDAQLGGMRKLLPHVIGTDFKPEDHEDREHEYTDVFPITFVRPDEGKIVPIVDDAAAVHLATTKWFEMFDGKRCTHADILPFEGQTIDRYDNEDSHAKVSKDHRFRATALRERDERVLPSGVTLLVHAPHGIVGLNGWTYREVAGDAIIGEARDVLDETPPRKTKYVRGRPVRIKAPVPKKSVTRTARGPTLVVDVARTIRLPENADAAGPFLAALREVLAPTFWQGLQSVIVVNVVPGADVVRSTRACGLAPDKTEAWSGVVGDAKSTPRLIVSTGVLTSVQDYEETRLPLSENDYARVWMERFQITYRHDAERHQREIVRLEQQLGEHNRLLGERLFILDLLDRAGVEAFRAYLEMIHRVPGVIAVRFQREGIVVFTEDVWYRGPLAAKNGGPRFFGRYRFVVDIIGGGITVQNLALHTADQSQTCIGCMGSFSSHLGDCLRNLDYAGLVRVLLEYVRSPNLVGDGANYETSTYRAQFRDHAPTTPIAGKPKSVYAGVGANFNAELRARMGMALPRAPGQYEFDGDEDED